MKDNHEVYDTNRLEGTLEMDDIGLHDCDTYENINRAIKLARVDTLQHLLKQFEANSKKINGTMALFLINDLINEIKKS
jgi:hypothetical protein